MHKLVTGLKQQCNQLCKRILKKRHFCWSICTVILSELDGLSEFLNIQTKRGRASVKCCRKAGRFPTRAGGARCTSNTPSLHGDSGPERTCRGCTGRGRMTSDLSELLVEFSGVHLGGGEDVLVLREVEHLDALVSAGPPRRPAVLLVRGVLARLLWDREQRRRASAAVRISTPRGRDGEETENSLSWSK